MTVHRTPVVNLVGRELGYRIALNWESEPSPDAVDAAYRKIDLPRLVSDRWAFIDATPRMLDGDIPASAAKVALVLPAGFEGEEHARTRAAALHSAGASLALTGYTGTPEQAALLTDLSFVWVTAQDVDQRLAQLVRDAHARNVKVFVTSIGTMSERSLTHAAGVDGTLGTRRALSAGSPARPLRAAELQCLAILRHLVQPEPAFGVVADLIATDPALSVRVLQLVNSGAYALGSRVDTINQAVVLLGPRDVTAMVATLAVQSRPHAMDSLWFILARAIAVERLTGDPAGYTVGLLSALIEQTDAPVESVLREAGVSEAVAEAIRSDRGTLGAALVALRMYAQRDMAGVLTAGWSPAQVSTVYVGAVSDALAIAGQVMLEQ